MAGIDRDFESGVFLHHLLQARGEEFAVLRQIFLVYGVERFFTRIGALQGFDGRADARRQTQPFARKFGYAIGIACFFSACAGQVFA